MWGFGHLRPDLLSVLSFVLLAIGFFSDPVLSDLVLSKVERHIDLTSQVVRITSSIKVVSEGSDLVSDFLLTYPDHQAKNIAYLSVTRNEGKGKAKGPAISLPVEVADIQGMPAGLISYSVSLPKGLGKGESTILEVLVVFTHALKPFPEKITQADLQLVLFQDSAYFLSPYPTKVQSVSVKLPPTRIEFYTKLENTKVQSNEITYGPYENLPPYSYTPIAVHYENNEPFALAKELVREIEISHWGNVQITENYELVHAGATAVGEFSRLDFQARPNIRGASAFKNLVAKLPPRAHSVYYRDEIGNISTSHLWSDLKKTELEIEPRYPMFGGWRTAFTIGYGLPLQDFLFASEGKRFLNMTFGCSMNELVIDKLVVKVVLPEGSSDISVSVPFPVKQEQEMKMSHLDIAGRPVVVLEKTNVVLPEHNQHFQVYYKFSSLSLLMKPVMLIIMFFSLFIACIVYMHVDMSISKTSASYLAKQQWEEVQASVQLIQNIIHKCLSIHERLEASLRDLSRTGDVSACKATRKAADASLKELSKELKPLLAFLQSSSQAAHILPKVEELVTKERELQEKLMIKHSAVVDSYEKKSGGREIETRIAAQQQKIVVLKQEMGELLDIIDEI